jgi:hypothetical protein
MNNNGGSAFPIPDEGQGWGSAGMSLRDWFAGQIAAGMAAHSGTSGVSFGPHDIAGRSYQVADALLKAREEPHGE